MKQWVIIYKLHQEPEIKEVEKIEGYHALGNMLGGKDIYAFRPYGLFYKGKQVFIGVDIDAYKKRLEKNKMISHLFLNTIYGDVVILLEDRNTFDLEGLSSKEEALDLLAVVLQACK